ncbi:DUF2169 family type VI secretion system accessory protein [Caballeronia zhejiangensis]|uniref:DUF2169 family type VI secretion system accessory protein n=1 Tax=Caballeronia zhejiangensis TaxID=871203 RepID=UPI00158DD862|nr:pentapeptide repeat-containing protein [Caballeronia zhejiangensis]
MRVLLPTPVDLSVRSWRLGVASARRILSFQLGFALDATAWRSATELKRIRLSNIPAREVFDLGLDKCSPEWLLWGQAASAQASPYIDCSVRLRERVKTLRAWGERHWEPGPFGWRISSAMPTTCVELSWASTYGGSQTPENPLGAGDAIAGAMGANQVLLPPLELLHTPKRQPDQPGIPAGFGAKAFLPDQTIPSQALPFPGLAIEPRTQTCQLAPGDQIVHAWHGDEAFELRGFHRDHHVLHARLPGVKLRSFIHHANESAYRELPCTLDTVILFPGALSAALIFRASFEEHSEHAAKTTVIAGVEALASDLPPQHYYRTVTEALAADGRTRTVLLDKRLLPDERPIAPALRLTLREASKNPEEAALHCGKGFPVCRDAKDKTHAGTFSSPPESASSAAPAAQRPGALLATAVALTSGPPLQGKTPSADNSNETQRTTAGGLASSAADPTLQAESSVSVSDNPATSHEVDLTTAASHPQNGPDEMLAEALASVNPDLGAYIQRVHALDALQPPQDGEPDFTAMAKLIQELPLSDDTRPAAQQDLITQGLSGILSGLAPADQGMPVDEALINDVMGQLYALTQATSSASGSPIANASLLNNGPVSTAQSNVSGTLDAMAELASSIATTTEISQAGIQLGAATNGSASPATSPTTVAEVTTQLNQAATAISGRSNEAGSPHAIPSSAELASQSAHFLDSAAGHLGLTNDIERPLIHLQQLAASTASGSNTAASLGARTALNSSALLDQLAMGSDPNAQDALAALKAQLLPDAAQQGASVDAVTTVSQALSEAALPPVTSSHPPPSSSTEAVHVLAPTTRDQSDDSPASGAVSEAAHLRSGDAASPSGPKSIGGITKRDENELVKLAEAMAIARHRAPSVIATPRTGQTSAQVGLKLLEAARQQHDFSDRDFSFADLRGADLRGADLRGILLEGADLRETDLTGARLDGAALQGTLLDGASLHGASLQGANLSGSRAHGANLTNATLNDCILDEADFSQAICAFAVLSRVRARRSIWRDARLERSSADLADLDRADMTGAVLTYAMWPGARLMSARIDHIDGTGINLSGARLVGASACYACLNQAVLNDCNFQQASAEGLRATKSLAAGSRWLDADIQGSDFTQADLTDASFASATLDKAFLVRALLKNALFNSASAVATSFDGAQLFNAQLHALNASNASFRFANMELSKLDSAMLRNADLTGANLLHTLVGDLT